MIWFFKNIVIIENPCITCIITCIANWIMSKYDIALFYYVWKFQQIKIFE